MIGTAIDGCFRVLSYLGEGRFGIVYRCHDMELDRDVAVKLLKPDSAGPTELKILLTEARRLAALSHPNVVQAFRLGNWNGSPYIAMELIEGKTLLELSSESRLSLREAVKAMRQVAAGLRAIHEAGIIHRDLSPNNIMITRSGIAKILDLGLSKNLARMTSIETEGVIKGTLAYIAPELVQGQPASARAEIFSFGVILYEVISGRNPFRAEHLSALLYNITSREAEPLDTYVRACPVKLTSLVGRCMNKQPDQRPLDMAEVERALDEILGQADFTSTERVLLEPVVQGPRQTPSNPYLNRVMIKRPEDFFGRRHETKRIYARLNATPPGSVSIVGDRKIGKSSLLNYVYMRQQRQEYLEVPEKMIMVFLDLQEEKNMSMESFVRAMLGITTYELRGRLDVSHCTHNLDGVKDMVQRLDAGGFRLALLLDEFDIVTTNSNFDLEFFSFLRYLANHYNVAYLTSSARDLQVLCHTKEIADSPFFNIFSNMRLSVLDRGEAAELIREPSQRAGRPLAPYTEEILAMSGEFPFFIQMACAHTFEYLEENPSSTQPDFGEIRKRFYAEAKLHFRYIWENFDQHEKSAVMRVAKGRAVPDSLQHVLQELGARHYIEPVADKTRLFAPTFEEFVKTEADGAGQKSLLGKIFGRA
ncbi:MAG TPA: protein kinase [Candidatus Eisenbacteria bacterium]|jgi:serine/threonine protein kinase